MTKIRFLLCIFAENAYMNITSLAKKIKKRIWFRYRIACINAFIRLSIGYIILHLFKRELLKKKIWIIMERATEARDNGFWFFCYMRENHPDIDTYYVIVKDSPDEKKLERFKKNVIHYNSYKHIFHYLTAECSISTHERGITSPYCFHGYTGYSCIESLSWFVPKKQIIVFLQHGITQKYISLIDREQQPKHLRAHLFITAISRERDFIETVGHWPKSTVICTGFSRFDSLFKNMGKCKNQILIMPTWRNWLAASNTANKANATEQKKFMNSPYFKTLQQLLNSNDITNLLNTYNFQLIFYLHYELQSYIDAFSSNNPRVTIVSRNAFDVQRLLIESSILITDYSSVAFDFAYMRKPLIYYQFDQKEYRKKYPQEGYFSYESDGFGPVVLQENDLITQLENILKNNSTTSNIYSKRINNFFPPLDNLNSERIFNAILHKLKANP